MAKSNNVLTKGLSGSIGKSLTFRQIGGETFVSKFQGSTTIAATEKKLAARSKFARATAYAKGAVKNPETKAWYQGFVKGGQRAFNIAIRDALYPPTVEFIQTENYQGRVGDEIIIRATDEFKVAGVIVTIFNPAGEQIEEGNAGMQENGTDWLYTTTSPNHILAGSKITATATDTPGNRSSVTVNL